MKLRNKAQLITASRDRFHLNHGGAWTDRTRDTGVIMFFAHNEHNSFAYYHKNVSLIFADDDYNNYGTPTIEIMIDDISVLFMRGDMDYVVDWDIDSPRIVQMVDDAILAFITDHQSAVTHYNNREALIELDRATKQRDDLIELANRYGITEPELNIPAMINDENTDTHWADATAPAPRTSPTPRKRAVPINAIASISLLVSAGIMIGLSVLLS